MKTILVCPACGYEQLERVARRGFLREKLFPIFGFYPWECVICRKEFLIRKRGVRYRRVTSVSEVARDHVVLPEGSRNGS